MVLGVAVGELGALLARPALPAAEVLDRGDEVALLVGEGEVHGGKPYPGAYAARLGASGNRTRRRAGLEFGVRARRVAGEDDETAVAEGEAGVRRTIAHRNATMPLVATAIVTGSGGLIGSEAVGRLIESGFDVIGLENDMRAKFFGPDASTVHMTRLLTERYPEFRSLDLDVRDADGVDSLWGRHAREIELVVHAAAQPSHDWAAREPQTDFAVNANGTLNLLEANRRHAPGASFVFISTNKVYGDTPNRLPLEELDTRLELPEGHRYHGGIDTSMSIDASMHSLFGASKAAADLLVQEYGRYFGMPTVCLRGGCLTGPNHAGTMLHGFLSYLMRCTVTGESYRVFGYGGKQVRDNIHSADLVEACMAFHRRPARRPCTTSAAAGRATARCWRRSRSASGSPARSCRGS